MPPITFRNAKATDLPTIPNNELLVGEQDGQVVATLQLTPRQ
ncbi:hypothetical protein [Corallococcus exercitus]|nr:hypothetical protein [Corallococcus exercitus]